MSSKRSFIPPKADPKSVVELVAIEASIRSHLIGLQKAISRLPSEDERRRAKKDVSTFLETGSVPPEGFLL